MLRSSQVGRAILVILLAGAWVWAQDAAALLKQADADLRAAERAMYAGKLADAATLLAQASENFDKAKAANADPVKLRQIEPRLTRLKLELERRTGKPVVSATAPAGDPAPAAAGGDALPSAVTRRLTQIDTALAKAEAICKRDLSTLKPYNVQTAEQSVREAVETMAELNRSYGDKIPAGHPQVAQREQAIATMQGKVAALGKAVADAGAAAAQNKAQAAATSEQWLAKLRMYVASPGNPDYDKEHSIIVSPGQDPAEIARLRKLHAEAAAVLAECKKLEVPGGKSDQLLQAERDMEFHLNGLASSLGGASDEASRQAQEGLDAAERQLATQEANQDPAAVPNPLRQGWIDELKAQIAQASATSTDPAAGDAMNKRLADVAKRDAALRELRKQRIVQKPDRFAGEDLPAIKSRATELVLEKNAGAKILATTVTSADWKEESVVESTDTTNTALRHRVTRSVTSQVAARNGDTVTLFTVYVAKDRRTDNTWGPLYGNIMYSDQMLEANVAGK